MALKLKGSTSGFVAIDAPSVAGNNTLILPENTGSAHQILANDITAGVTTFTQITVSRNGDLTVPGTISIGGTLTYEDVTSVDSVGIVTARGLSIFGNTTGLQVASGISTFQALTGTTGTFSGAVSGTTGTFTGAVNGVSARFLSSTNPQIISENSSGGVGIRLKCDNGSAGTLSFSDAAADNQGMILYHHAFDRMQFSTNGSERIRILSDGKVGINTINPAQQFTSYAASGYPVLANGPSNGIGLGGNGVIVFGTFNLGAYAPGAIDASTFAIKTSGTERLTLTSGGTLGINDTSPDTNFKLDVGGSANIQGNVAVTNTGRVYFGNSDVASIDGAHGGSGYLKFLVAGGEKVRIVPSGYVHLGNSGHGTNKVGGQDVTGEDFDPVFKIYQNTSNHWLMQLRSDNNTGSNGIFMRAGRTTNDFTMYLTGTDEHKKHLIVRGDGNCGIKTDVPLDKLHIDQGALRFRNYNGNSDVKSLYFPVYLTAGTTILADMGNTDSGTVGFAKIDYVSLYSYGGQDMGMGTRYASIRRTNSDSGWRVFSNQAGQNNGENYRPNLFWVNGQLQVDVAGSVQVTGMVTVICHSNSASATLTRNVDLSH